MTQLKYAFSDVIKNLFKYLLMFLQITVSLILLSYGLTMVTDIGEVQNKLNAIPSENNYFVVRNADLSQIQQIFDREGGVDDIKELYEYITYHFNSFSHYTQTYNAFPHQRDQDDWMDVLFTTDSFLDFFDIRFANGGFGGSEFLELDITPVAVGYNISDSYTIGQIFMVDGEKFKVVDFLQRGQSYFDLLGGVFPHSLDDSIISNLPRAGSLNYYGMHSSLLFYIVVEADSREDLQRIQEKSNALNLYTFEFLSLEEQFERARYLWDLTIQFWLLISISVLIVCLISMISNLLQFLDANRRNFVIHMLCGATLKSIMLRIFLQVFIVIALCIIILFWLAGITNTSIFSAALAILVGAIMLAFPIVKLSKTNFIDLLK